MLKSAWADAEKKVALQKASSASSSGSSNANQALYKSAPLGPCFLLGSWDKWKKRQCMEWDGLHYRGVIRLRDLGAEENFQIMLGETGYYRLYPSVHEAGLRGQHRVLGPSTTAGKGMNWILGRDPSELVADGGMRYLIALACPRLGPLSVHWRQLPARSDPTAESRILHSASRLSAEAEAWKKPPRLHSGRFEADVEELGEELLAEEEDEEEEASDDEEDTQEFRPLYDQSTGINKAGFFLKPMEQRRQQSPYGSYFILGSWDGFSTSHAMDWDGSSFRFLLDLRSGEQEASFRILSEGDSDRIIYPSNEDANPNMLHQLQGPSDLNLASDRYWTVERDEDDDMEERPRYEIVMQCPRGIPICLGWTKLGERSAALSYTEKKDWIQVGVWRALGRMGQDRKDGTVTYMAQPLGMGVNGKSALKFPVPFAEIHALSLLQDVQGIPRLLDFGRERGGGLFYTVPLLFPSLEDMLQQRNLDGSGGRISWPAAQGLGLAVLALLRAIHARGIMHCNIKPTSVLVPDGEMWPHLVNFGAARPIGDAHFEAGMGGKRDYMSIRAGIRTGQRRPADDLESLGWVLLRCVTGKLPWAEEKNRKGARNSSLLSGKKKRELAKHTAEEKMRFFDFYDPECNYFPKELQAYLTRAQSMADDKYEDIDYEALMAHFTGADRSWEELVERRLGALDSDGAPMIFRVVKGKVVFKKPGNSLGAEDGSTLKVQKDLLIQTTGRALEDTKGETGQWIEVDPVWAPGQPEVLLTRCWLQVLESGTRTPLLLQVDMEKARSIAQDQKSDEDKHGDRKTNATGPSSSSGPSSSVFHMKLDLSLPLGILFDDKLQVKDVTEGSQAAKAGVCQGWLAQSLGGEPLQASKSLVMQIKVLKAQGVRSVSLTFLQLTDPVGMA